MIPNRPRRRDDIAFVVCMRLPDLQPLDPADPTYEWEVTVRARSTIEECSDCQAQIICDTTSPKEPPRICFQCALLRIEAGGTVQ